ncbi:MAG: PKD domain-containing protein [Thermoplasmata archaeon]|nr:MAG: PKD domain-containing protein [Thermoplasmata archaeon]
MMLMVHRVNLGKALPIVMLALLVLSVVPMPSMAVEVSEEMEIDTNDRDFIQRVDGDGDGNFHVIYLSDEPGGDWFDLMYKKLSPAGDVMVDSIQLTPSNMDASLRNSAIAVDDAGRAHVAMVIRTDNVDAYSVFYAQVGAAGTLAVSAKKIYEDGDGTSPMGIDIEADGMGNAYIVWEQTTDPTSIMWAKVSSAGAISKQATTISGDLQIGGFVSYPRIGVASNGDSMVVWQQKSNQLARVSIWYTQLDSGGTVDVDPRESVSSTITDLLFLEATAHAADNELHVVYMEGNDAQYAKLDRDGDSVSSRTLYSDFIGEAMAPDIAVAKNGDMFISFAVRDAPISSPWNLFTQVYWYDDDNWDDRVQVNEGDGASTTSRPAATNTGGAVFFGRSDNLQMVTLTAEAANRPPVPSLSFSPIDPVIDETVTFDGRDSTDPDDEDTVEEYNFEFGDGSSSGWVTTQTVTHSYSAASTYTASLRVRDNHGLVSSSSDTVSVVVTSSTANKAPTAVIQATPTSAEVGDDVTFSGTSSFDTDGVVAQYLFTFGDGENSGWVSTSTVKHSYDSEGVFVATLKVRDDEGAESPVDSVQITVVDTNDPPVANIVSIQPNPALVGEEVTLTGEGTDEDGTVVAYSWESTFDLIIGDTAVLKTSTLSIGTHTIIFKVQDDDGAWSEAVSRDLTINANSKFTLVDKTELPGQAYTDKLIEFRVVYTDLDNDAPTLANLVYTKGNNWKTEPLREVDPGDVNYANGKEYFFNKKFDAADWTYHFEFKNSHHPKSTTTDVQFNVKEPEGLLPGPGLGAALGAVAVASFVVLVTRRGRKGQV